MIDIRNMPHIAEPLPDYIKAVDNARTADALREATRHFSPLFPDAYKVAKGLDDHAFLEWRSGLRKERRKEFAGDAFAQRYGAILMPEIAMEVGMLTHEFHVPFGLAFNRLVEVGRIKIKNGKAERQSKETP